MSLIKRYRQLSAAERGLFFRALFIVAALRLALWTVPFRLTQCWVSRRRKPAGAREPLDRHTISRVVWAVEAAARRIPRATCLTQGMATQVMLGQLGQASKLHLGVRNLNGKFEAHAWVEAQGCIINGSAIQDFDRFVVLENKSS
jgi:hypothetical protein